MSSRYLTLGVIPHIQAKARGAEKAKLTKSMIILDVKPWDDTTGALSHQLLLALALGGFFY